ncbi:hypothetical protein [Sulfuricurvum sp.]|uniref:hypothetical protein n=1 Tax=Sulfuricurvum sp. TaxID=2025608 RepID=UPI00261D6170|nr:hypothetical protein [Sulfuricurvum sp.]MDD2837777.1 hypothetical protein [Sulfuricurvum sp.]MDD3597040.1 hypothetical protein [Sulfuricurvum sp.]
MHVTSALNNLGVNTTSTAKQDDSVSQEYIDLINQLFQADPYQTRDEINANNTELATFKKDLITKGAAQFLGDLNQEKIDAIVEEYRDKLLKQQEENPNIPMDIDKMVSDFRKELLKEIAEAQKSDQKNTSGSQSVAMSTSDVLAGIKISQKSEDASSNTLSFLEQMLQPDTAKKEKELFV